MASIKQEPFSEEQWDQFIKNFENQPDAYIPGSQNTTFDHDESSVNNTAKQGFGSGTDQAADIVKSEPVDLNMDWTFMNPTDRPFEIPTDNVSALDLATDQVSSRLDGIKALLEENSRQINGIHQHLAGLYPFFQAIRATLKALTQHVNPQWEVKTPTTPVKMQHGKNSDLG